MQRTVGHETGAMAPPYAGSSRQQYYHYLLIISFSTIEVPVEVSILR